MSYAEASYEKTRGVSPGGSSAELTAERALLGGLLMDADQLAQVLEIVHADDFYRPEHGELLALLAEMARQNEPIDLVTVSSWMVTRSLKGDRYGGAGYVAELPEHCPSSANLTTYAATVRRGAELRRLVEVGVAMANAAHGSAIDIDGEHLVEPGSAPAEIGEQVSARILKIVSRRDSTDGTAEEVVAVVDEIVRARAGNTQPGLPTGIVALDEATDGGPRPTDLVVLAGRPGMGKTSLALNITEHHLADLGWPVGWFSQEMSKGQLLQRLLATVANVPLRLLRTPRLLTDEQVDHLSYCAQQIRRWPLYIDDRAGLTIAQVRAKSLQWKLRGVRSIWLDYLQLCSASHPKMNKTEAIGEVSTGCKKIAKDLEVMFGLLSQLNRDVEKRADKRPIQADLRDSGQIEQDADLIWFTYRDVVYNPSTSDPNAAEINVAKYRNGLPAVAKCAFDGSITRFRDFGPDDLL